MLGRRAMLGALAVTVAAPTGMPMAAEADPLPSWNDTAARRAIVDFVARSTSGADAIPPAARIAVFDNDGTLWCEQPAYAQAMATHAGMTTDQFAQIVTDWIAKARHPRFQRPYTELAYQPMLELLAYLRANGFRTYIVSGGGVEFMRPWAERVYGIPPEQVIGSTIKTSFRMAGGTPVLMRDPAIDAVDDGPGKPVGINRFIGRRPVFAAGNSDGDLQMLQWTTGAPGLRLGLIVHHTDAEREYAYDRQSHVGRLEKALDAAPQAGWVVVDMRRDWRRVFSFET